MYLNFSLLDAFVCRQCGFMKLLPLSVLSILLLAPSIGQAKDYQVYLLAGQSNMDGYGYTKDLPEGYDSFGDEVLIFHGNTSADDEPRDGKGIWAPLSAGHGTGFSSDGQSNDLSDRFGPELGIAKVLRAQNPSEPIAFIKYSRGGTTLDWEAESGAGNWNVDYGSGSGVNQYDHCLQTIRNAYAVSDIDGDGELDRLVPAGIFWMQGESDGHYLSPSYRYAENLQEIVTLFRAALRDDDLPVAVGRITDSGNDPSGHVWKFGNVVRAQQAAYCEADENAELVTSTDDYSYSDKYHYDSAGFIDLGEKFGEAILELQAE